MAQPHLDVNRMIFYTMYQVFVQYTTSTRLDWFMQRNNYTGRTQAKIKFVQQLLVSDVNIKFDKNEFHSSLDKTCKWTDQHDFKTAPFIVCFTYYVQRIHNKHFANNPLHDSASVKHGCQNNRRHKTQKINH